MAAVFWLYKGSIIICSLMGNWNERVDEISTIYVDLSWI